MRVLLDENVDPRFARLLTGFEVRTVQEQGWITVRNGELLRLAALEFGALVTRDRGIPHQQNLSGNKLVIAILRSPIWVDVPPSFEDRYFPILFRRVVFGLLQMPT